MREFELELLAAMKRAVVAGNLVIDTYRNDLPIVVNELNRCREITQQKVDSVHGEVFRLGFQYVPCDGRANSVPMEFTTMHPHKRRLFVTVTPGSEGWGHRLNVIIDFQHLPADRLPNNVDVVPYFRVLQAIIR
jgi:hypothetical protein